MRTTGSTTEGSCSLDTLAQARTTCIGAILAAYLIDGLTGKSSFLLYAFARALKEHIPVAFCNSPGEYYYCDGAGCRSYPTEHLVLHEVEHGKFFLALVDSSESVAIPPHNFLNRSQMCFTIQATSPQSAFWRCCRWTERRGASYWILQPWTEGEVGALQ